MKMTLASLLGDKGVVAATLEYVEATGRLKESADAWAVQSQRGGLVGNHGAGCGDGEHNGRSESTNE